MDEASRHGKRMTAGARADNRRLAVLALGVLIGGAVGSGLLSAQAVAPVPTRGAVERPLTPLPDSEFAAAVARLSEPSGFFDTDNLISNESSFLHVIPRLRALGVRGGAYLGVGPDQNYSYIAAIRPRIAYLVDVRRDNLLQHLMFKSLFARSSTRMEYLCLWLGRRLPPDPMAWRERSVDDIVGYVERAARDDSLIRRVDDDLVRDAVATGIVLTSGDRATLRRFHGDFAREGLQLRFTSFGRPPRASYPTLGDLILARDLAQQQRSYLAREDDWRYVKALHGANRIIPVVGNLAGTRALPTIARELRAARESVSAVYTSNVEFYLWGDPGFDAFARSLAVLPRDEHTVIIRSYFGREFAQAHPLAVTGFASVQLLQSTDDFLTRWRRGAWSSYRDLVTQGAR